ncbi:hypothetical protein BMS3Abin17_01357 [archaeon BMS3Abin17]|nr:hypothetical protein BMS3Abin17_01357 [archaeon BMS3Abin17]HDZ60913.1 hypothetical protein [Candidatus Pacearchaeota archaeon]
MDYDTLRKDYLVAKIEENFLLKKGKYALLLHAMVKAEKDGIIENVGELPDQTSITNLSERKIALLEMKLEDFFPNAVGLS